MECAWKLAVAGLMSSLYLGLTTVHCLRFEITPGNPRCVAEDIQANALVLGNYVVVAPGPEEHHAASAHKISARVASSYGDILHFGEKVDSGQFSFTASQAGDYIACFWVDGRRQETTVIVELDWKTGIAAKDWASIAKRDKIDGMQLELRKLEDHVNSIYDEILYLRGREEEMHQLNQTTSSRMAWFTFMSFLVCLSVAGWELWHLKRFFERKKML